MKTVAIVASLPNGAQIHRMGEDYFSKYRTYHRLVIPTTIIASADANLDPDGHPLYNNFAEVPNNLPTDTQIAIPQDNVGIASTSGSNVYNDFLYEDGTSALIVPPATPTPSGFGALGIGSLLGGLTSLGEIVGLGTIGWAILLVAVLVVVGFAIFAWQNVRLRELTPRCGVTSTQIVNVSTNVAVVETPDCGVHTIDKITGKDVSGDLNPKPPTGVLTGNLMWIVIAVAVIVVVMSLRKPAPAVAKG